MQVLEKNKKLQPKYDSMRDFRYRKSIVQKIKSFDYKKILSKAFFITPN